MSVDNDNTQPQIKGWAPNTLDILAQHPITDTERLHRQAGGAILLSLAAVSIVVLVFAALTVDFANDAEDCAIDKAADTRDPKPIQQLTAVRAFNGIVIAFSSASLVIAGVFGGIFIYQASHAPSLPGGPNVAIPFFGGSGAPSSSSVSSAPPTTMGAGGTNKRLLM